MAIDGVPQVSPEVGAEVGGLATPIPQEAEIFETTERENLCFGQPVDSAALQRAVVASALDEVRAGLPQGLDTVMSERGFNLSGGQRQRQRLALARGALDALIEQDVSNTCRAALPEPAWWRRCTDWACCRISTAWPGWWLADWSTLQLYRRQQRRGSPRRSELRELVRHGPTWRSMV